MDSNLTQNHLSLAQPSGKKTQQRVTMYSKRDQNTLLSRLFWILKVTWDVLINGSEGKLGKVGSGSQKHLICCRITWLCVIPRLHHTVRNEGVWTGRTQAVICTGPEEQCSWFLLLREVRLEEWDQMGCLPKRSKNTGSRPWRPCRSAVLNPRDSSGHGGKKSQFRDLIAQFSSSQRLTKVFKSILVSRENGVGCSCLWPQSPGRLRQKSSCSCSVRSDLKSPRDFQKKAIQSQFCLLKSYNVVMLSRTQRRIVNCRDPSEELVNKRWGEGSYLLGLPTFSFVVSKFSWTPNSVLGSS